MEYYDIILIVLLLLSSVLLFLLAGFSEKRKSSKWSVCYISHVLAAIFIVTFSGFEKYLLGAYFGAVILTLGAVKNSVKLRRAASSIAALAVLVSIPLCLFNGDYRSYDYAADFQTGFTKMKKYYVLSEQKEIDWDSLYDEYYPQFRTVTREKDEIGNLALWTKFCAEFNDGHVSYATADYEADLAAAMDGVMGNDYGLALMTLSDGRTAAVNVDSDSESARVGISNGTIITAWDGVSPEALESDALDYVSFSDKDNRDFYRTLICSGTGGDSVTVTFLDENGQEKTAVLPKIGAFYSGRYKPTIDIINSGINTGHLMWEEIDENTSALRLKLMMAGSEDNNNSYSTLRGQLIEKIEELKSEGKERIVLDMRGNGGGSGEMVIALTSVFAPKGEYYYCSDPVWNSEKQRFEKDENGNFLVSGDNYVTGEGIWNGELVIIVNAQSVSAADHLVSIMQGIPNVKIIGFTESNGSAQGVSGIAFDNGATLSFSGSLVLNSDGSVFIDSSASDMESGNGVDVIVPFDEEAIAALFDNGEDYLLTKANK